MRITLPREVAAWLRTPDDHDPETLRELRIQLASDGTEHHPAPIEYIVSLWHEVEDPTGRVRLACMADATGSNPDAALLELGHRLR